MPNLFTYIFMNPNEQILALSSTAIRIYFVGFFVIGLNMFIIGLFSIYSKTTCFHLIPLSFQRVVYFAIIFVFVLPPLIGVIGIWVSVPLAEFITLIAGIYFLKKNEKERIS